MKFNNITPARKIRFAVATGGAVTMTLEMLGFSILAPYFGMSLSVSSNIILVVLLGLAGGYFAGGIIGDRFPKEHTLALVFLGTATYATVVIIFREWLLGAFAFLAPTVTLGSLFSTIVILGIPSIGLGAILPIAIRIAEKETGKLYSLSAIGSIVGTFLGGFLLVPLGNLSLTLALPLGILFFCTLLLETRFIKFAISGFAVLVAGIFIAPHVHYSVIWGKSNRFIVDGAAVIDRKGLTLLDDVTSPYNRIQVFEGKEEQSGRPIRLMRVNRELHSGNFLDGTDFLFNYTRFNALGGHFNPNARKALLLGGGGYSYAKFFLSDTPLHDVLKEWELNNKYISNDNKLSIPILMTTDPIKITQDAKLIYTSPNPPQGSEIEGTEGNIVEAHNQHPSTTITASKVVLNETHMPCETGFIHVHEISKNGMPGAIISEDHYLPKVVDKPGLLVGQSDLLPHGESDNIDLHLNRQVKDDESVVVMLHRDNCNNRFDSPLVDGYEKIEFLDVVEIDPKTTELAKKYFSLDTSDPRLRIFHEDARTFINTSKDKYDIIYFDAFRSFYNLPYQLSTKEAVQKMYDMLNPGGVLVLNTPSALGGAMGKFFQAEYKTYASVFPALHVYAVTSPLNLTIPQNIVTIAFKSKDNIRETLNDDPLINERLTHLWTPVLDADVPILTDDFAPVDYYVNAMRNIRVD